MLNIDDQPRTHLLEAIRRGRAFLALGAGASKTSRNRFGKEVLLGGGLAQLLCDEAGIPYSNEPLKDVISATIPSIISEARFHEILREQFFNITPSKELNALLKFSWKRLYTWNIDDAIASVTGSVQRLKFYNGMLDKAYTDYEINTLPVIQLHGDAGKPEHGFIFSEDQYNQRLIAQNHHWYRQLAQDYTSFVPIFIGSQLEEPILSAELERARPARGAGLGQAYLVSPSAITQIKRLSLEARQIIYIQATLLEFTDFLRAELGNEFGPAFIASEISKFASETVKAKNLTSSEAVLATYIFQHRHSAAYSDAAQYPIDVQNAAARKYLEGNPPSWRTAVSDTPVWLTQTSDLYKSVCKSIFEKEQIFVVIGQAGSGKSTAIMQCLLRYSQDHSDIAFYEIRAEVPSLKSALRLMSETISDDHIIVYIADAFAFGDSFAEDIFSIPEKRMTVFTSARTGEWNSRIKRQINSDQKPFKFERFAPKDFQPLIDRLLKYVPSPTLLRMTPSERKAKLGQSNSQLLIALKETTYADAFTNVITNEFESLPSFDEQRLLLICGLGSLSRAGVDRGAAREAYDAGNPQVSFKDALHALDGIVIEQATGRLSARHELYVRHIFEAVANLDEVLGAITSILKTFTKYQHPIMKTVTRLDSILFKYLLSHNFLKDLSKSHSSDRAGLRVYEQFEIDFQLDGHYWLQYGQYLSEIGEHQDAMSMFDKSIQAYPENEYAVHALADCQLKVAATQNQYDAHTRELIRRSVTTLLAQDEALGGPTDHYAIVTLAHGHIGVLVAHKQTELALEAAKRYLGRIQAIRLSHDNDILSHAYSRLLKFTISREWKDSPFNMARNVTSDRRNRNWRQRS